MKNFREILKRGCFLLFLLSGILFINATVFALEVDWPKSPGVPGVKLTDTSNLGDLVQYLYEWGIALGGLAVFLVLIFAGFQYLTSVGDPTKMKEARGKILAAFGGLVLLLASWLILNTLNPQLTGLEIPDLQKELQAVQKQMLSEQFKEWEEARKISTLPCDKAILYSADNYHGKQKDILPSRTTESIKGEITPYSARILRILTNKEKGWVLEGILYEKGLSNEEIKEIKNDSGKIEQKIVEYETEFEEGLMERYEGFLRDNNKYYIDSGACSLSFYMPQRGLWASITPWTEKTEVDTIYSSMSDLTMSIDEDVVKKIKWVKLTQLKLE